MTETPIRIVVAGVPRSYQRPHPDGRWLTAAHETQIRAVSPRLQLIHTSRRAILAGQVPIPGADVLMVESCGRGEYGEELPLAAFAPLVTPRLRWLQTCSSGVGHVLELGIVPPQVVMTNAAGIHAAALAESTLAAILLHAKQLVTRFDDQRERRWRELQCIELRGKTVCVIGTGHIGKAIAARASAFGLRVVGVRRHPQPVAGFDAVYGHDALHRALATAEFVVVACPLTAETDGMIDAGALAAMRPGAYLVNIARGRILRDGPVLDALRSGHLGGAFLDAFAPEPLPRDHPYWDAPNVTVTPHDSHSSEFIGDNMVDLFTANLRRWLEGAPLANVIDRARGY